eukprot:CAMPEP_0194594944 /NCGR_PEP_ID=MMETSP0292-20121207/24615_1 /TAXON_ID=39354 /ORGANISM="Heterosigma akashiwo, Strain CCMP2393" /LENGTH=76 /DNA_ID=CAMNT_0039454611 /DNA_START=1 /DNA_END=227 /DNA_ORIENTATION=+
MPPDERCRPKAAGEAGTADSLAAQRCEIPLNTAHPSGEPLDSCFLKLVNSLMLIFSGAGIFSSGWARCGVSAFAAA